MFGPGLWRFGVMADPLREMQRVQREMNRIFSGLGQPLTQEVPPVNVWVGESDTVVTAELPGVDEKSVEVILEKNVLTITGAVEPQAFPGRSIAYAEYDVGDYERAFTVSDEIDRKRIEAVVKNGVLKIALHKAPQAEVKKITVRTE